MKKNKSKKILAILLAVTSMSLFTACGSKSAENDGAETVSETAETESAETQLATDNADSYEGLVIRVATATTSTFRLETTVALNYLEEEFADDGITIEYVETASGPAFVDAVAADQVDLGIFGDQPLIAGFASGKPVEIIASYSQDSQNINLIASPDSGITTPADIKGKRISYNAGTTEEKTIKLILEDEGLTEDDVELINLSDADAKVALESGDVDAHVFFGAVGISLINEGYTLVTSIAPYAADVQIVAANTNFVEAYPEITARFLQVLDRTVNWIADNREDAVKLVAEIRSISEEQADQFYDLEDRKIGFSQADADGLNVTAKFLYDAGLVSELYTTDDFVDTTYLQLAGLSEE